MKLHILGISILLTFASSPAHSEGQPTKPLIITPIIGWTTTSVSLGSKISEDCYYLNSDNTVEFSNGGLVITGLEECTRSYGEPKHFYKVVFKDRMWWVGPR